MNGVCFNKHVDNDRRRKLFQVSSRRNHTVLTANLKEDTRYEDGHQSLNANNEVLFLERQEVGKIVAPNVHIARRRHPFNCIRRSSQRLMLLSMSFSHLIYCLSNSGTCRSSAALTTVEATTVATSAAPSTVD
eukprot:Blabericola_migrator_1__6838@NODE_3465_length_1749_cov_81_727111_g2155_i0_p1_GENE_NODE_3465_length_1749_cov_81_727111_g2155_i0NODE_3465_length_1749_cov_81_727111_g2155_i0_p1_ORF_typecomplete_len133_score11_87_NODE_3465_length_1749_cov_81_727111_g2155_i0315713